MEAMENETPHELSRLLDDSRSEVRQRIGKYERLLRQLDQLSQALESGHMDRGVLDTTLAVFSEFRELQPIRAGTLVVNGLDATRAVLIEVHNRVKQLSQERR
jgi:hypothetical protein